MPPKKPSSLPPEVIRQAIAHVKAQMTSPPSVPVPAFQMHDPQRQVWEDQTPNQVLNWHRKSRKTTLALNKLIAAAATHQNHTYFHVFPKLKQAKATLLTDQSMLPRYLPASALSKPFNQSDLVGTFHSGSTLRIAGADRPDSLRGPACHGVVFDEWAQMKPETYTEIFRPLLAASGGWALFCFTPKGKNHAWDTWQRAQQGGHWKAWELKASQSGLIPQWSLDEAKADMLDAFYSQEFECAWLEGAMSVFRGWPACVLGELEPPQLGRRYVLGGDFGRSHDATVYVVIDVVARHVVAFLRLTDTMWGVQRQALADLAKRYNNAWVWIDTTGITAGDPIAEDLRQLGLSVEGVKFSSQSKRELVELLRLAIASRLITFPKIPQLEEELEEFQITMGKTGQIYYGCPEGEGYFDDCVIALALAVKGLGADLYGPPQKRKDDKEDWRDEWRSRSRQRGSAMAA